MKNVFVIRHGETDVNKNNMIQGRSVNASINEVGRQQAIAVVKALEAFNIEKIVSSSLNRTYETAQPLIQHCGFDCDRYEDLDELDFGELEGKAFSAIGEHIDQLHAEWKKGNTDLAVHGGESPLQAFERANRRIQHILYHSPEQNIAFIIHGRLIRILLSEWLDYGLQNMHKIEHSNGVINHLRWEEGTFTAVELNMTDHLQGLSNEIYSKKFI